MSSTSKIRRFRSRRRPGYKAKRVLTNVEPDTTRAEQPTASQDREPYCRVMRALGELSSDATGVALVRNLTDIRPGRIAVSILAHGLPPPTTLGNFNAYQGLAFVPGIIAWTFQLYNTPEAPPTWAGTFTEITLDPTGRGRVQVRPYNTQTNQVGMPVLAAILTV